MNETARYEVKTAGVVAGMERKTAAATVAGDPILGVDPPQGVVTAVVSVTGVIDDDRDIIMPGAYTKTLKARRPKVLWHHDWDSPIGRVEQIEELLPGDPRLPKMTKTGAPWPAEAGALVATMRFNLRTDRGRRAFEDVRFYSETGEAEYSIGYVVREGKTRGRDGVRRVRELDLYEVSAVPFGANSLSGTLSLKAAKRTRGRGAGGGGEQADWLDLDAPDAPLAGPVAGAEGEGLDPWADPPGGAGGPGGPGGSGVPGDLEDVDVLDGPEDLDGLGGVEADPDRPHVFEVPEPSLMDPAPAPDVCAVCGRHVADPVHRAQPAATPPATGPSAGPAAPPPVAGGGAKSRVPGPRGRRRAGRLGRKCFDAGGGSIHPAGSWEERRDLIANAVRELLIPVDEPDAGEEASVDEPGDGDPDAGGLGAGGLGGGVPGVDDLGSDLGAGGLPDGQGGEAGEVPPWRQPTGQPGDGEAGGQDGEAGGLEDDDAVQWVAADINGTWDDHVIATRYGHQPVPGGQVKIESYEIPYSIGEDGSVMLGDPQPVKLTLTPVPTTGAGRPTPTPGPGPDSDPDPAAAAGEVPSPLPGMIDDTTMTAKMLLAAGGMEAKAGRVLSGLNRDRLVQAVQSLLDVLAAAGVTLDPPGPDENAGQDVDELGADITMALAGEQDSTAPSARPEGKRLIPPGLYAAGLRMFLDARS